MRFKKTRKSSIKLIKPTIIKYLPPPVMFHLGIFSHPIIAIFVRMLPIVALDLLCSKITKYRFIDKSTKINQNSTRFCQFSARNRLDVGPETYRDPRPKGRAFGSVLFLDTALPFLAL